MVLKSLLLNGAKDHQDDMADVLSLGRRVMWRKSEGSPQNRKRRVEKRQSDVA